MNLLRKIRKKREKKSVDITPQDRNQESVQSTAATVERQSFFTIEEAKTWVGKNREETTPIKYDPGHVAGQYPEPTLTLEEGASVLINPELFPVQFKYNRLTGQNIRLLMLRPGRGYDPMGFDLQETSLNYPVSYQALSYTWGDPTPRYQFNCNAASLFIAINLHDALWQFRELGILGPFWIDAVCINQSDIEEKTDQIKMMRSVYEQAALVRIWLGEASNVTANGIALLRHAYNAILEQQKEPDPAEAYISLTSFGLGGFTVDDIATLWHLYVAYWFERSWVVQELAVSTKAIFQWGTHEIEAEVMLSVTAMLSRTLTGSNATEASRPWSKIESLKPFRFPASVFADVRLQYEKGRKLTLAELLRCTAQLKATEPHDKIFAFVGLASDGDVSMIDYKTPLRDLHLSVAKSALLSDTEASSTRLDFLSLVKTYLDTRDPTVQNIQQIKQLGLDSSLSSQNLPSWAPDLTHYDDFFGNSIVPLATVFPSSSMELATNPEVHLLDNEVSNPIFLVRTDTSEPATSTVALLILSSIRYSPYTAKSLAFHTISSNHSPTDSPPASLHIKLQQTKF